MTISRPDKYSILEIVGKVKICCPAGGNLMTPYILREQQDWFEDEIKFLREIVRPDTKFIDIGANYGLYSLSIANLCRDGHVWSYEPGSETAGYLNESIGANKFHNLTLINKALSNKAGVGRLLTGDNSELNALTNIDDQGRGEQVELTTLESERAHYDWKHIDIVKIDAEGHELQVLEGGIQFFATTSPLVMCEIKASKNVDFTPVNFLVSHGYKSYRLIPGLQALAPQDLKDPIDDFQLNIFCCKPDCAAGLLARNRLVMNPAPSAGIMPGAAVASWPEFLRAFPYGGTHVDQWLDRSRKIPYVKWSEYEAALNLYALARNTSMDITSRYDALCSSYRILETLVQQTSSMQRLLSFARVALDFGMRKNAVHALAFFLKSIEGRAPDIAEGEPFLCPSGEYEFLPPVHTLHNWAITSALDAYERFRTFSSYFTSPHDTVKIANEIKRLGYSTPAMERRAEVAKSRLQYMV